MNRIELRRGVAWYLGLLVWVQIAVAEKNGELELIDVAGQQRMLSQQIAKDYFYLARGVRKARVARQLKSGVETFLKNHQTLLKRVKDPEIRALLDYLGMAVQDLAALARQPFTPENGLQVLDQSEAILEGSEMIVQKLEQAVGLRKTKLVNLAGRQRMLAQRIAKLYMAYQAGLSDKALVESLNKAVDAFEKAHATLVKSRATTPAIAGRLAHVQRLWQAVVRFYRNVDKVGLPVIVLTTTDRLTQEMDEIVKLYEQAG